MADPVRPEEFFRDRYGVSAGALERVLGSALARHADDGDLYFEFRTSEALSLEEGQVKKANKDVSQGVGVRVVAGEKTGFAYTDDVTITTLTEAARTAGHIASGTGDEQAVAVRSARPERDLYALPSSPLDTPLPTKIALLEAIDRAARAYDPRIKNVFASLSVEQKLVMIATADGRLVSDVQPLARLNVTCIAEDANGRQQGTYGGGGRQPFSFLVDGDRHLRFAREAARQAILNLDAVDAPAGKMTVVLGPGWPGILLHEAIGHGLEGDFNRKGTSAFANLLGQRVASELCTVIDDGTIANRRGSLNVDDEGTPTSRTVLIERGILRGYLQDRLNARLMGVAPTGNGRRESYASAPMPRMTNTFMLAGDSTPEEILRSVDRGLYAVSFGGGQVDITSGKFVFSASEAYLVEGGKVTRPVKGATLIGNGPDVLTRIDMVGHDLQLDEGIGTCGKNGQSVPVGVGLPTIRIAGLTVGGNARVSTQPSGDAMEATLRTLLDHATNAGAAAADAVMVESTAFAAGVRLGEIEKLTDARERRLGLRVFAGASVAIAATADLTPSGLARFAADTVGLARVTASDPLAGLPEPSLLATDRPDLDLYDAAADAPNPDHALAQARAAESAALAVDARLNNSEGAEFSQDASTIAYASTLGFAGSYRRSSFHLGVEPVATADGAMQRDFWYARARHLARLEEPAAIGRRAAERTLRRLGARRVKTQEAPVIFESTVAVSLLGHLAGAVTGQSLYRGTSFLLGRLGDTIAAPCITVVDDGRLPNGHGSRPFDAEGLPTRRTVVVERGKLTSYLLDTYSGKRLALPSTGNAARSIGDAPTAAPTNLYLEAGPYAPEAIIASVERGLLVTELIGFGVNAVTGDYSRGAAGLWIEHGEIVHPVEEITIAGNLLDMFRDVEMVGNDLEFRGSMAAPMLKIGHMTIAGA